MRWTRMALSDENEITQLFDQMDHDKDGYLTYEEFLAVGFDSIGQE
ncbi:EF-hand domain-containing protein, partial [Serratia marcescens]